MKVLEVSTLHAGIDQVLNNIRNQREQLKQIERSIQAIVDLRDAFNGEGGQAIRGFFRSYHLSFLKDLLSFYDRYMETLEQIKNNLMALEPASDGFIRESYLEHEVFNGLQTIKERTRSLTDETNQIISSVADIVALPKLDDSYVLHGITMADQQRDETIGKLHTFDQQQTSGLLPLENTVRAMVQYVQQVSTLFQVRNGSIPSIESVYYTQNFLQPNFSLFSYSEATLHKMSAWNHFYLNYLKSNPSPEVEQLISAREAEALIRKATDRVQVIDEYNGFSEVSAIEGKYYTLPDGRILRQYYTSTGVYKYEYVDKIPEERIGGVKPSDEAVSLILDFVPIISNGKAAIEAIIGEDIITGRKLSDVERSILVAAIVGGPLIKAVKVFGKTAMKQLPKVKNVLNPAKAKSFAKNLYDDFIKQGIDKGFSAAKSLAKKIADMPMPLSPKLATANGVPVTKTIGESMAEAKEIIVQMAGKVKGSVAGKVNDKNIRKAEINTAESIKNIINGRGYSVDEFAELLHPDRVLSDSEKLLVDSIRKEIGVPSAETLMSKIIPQSDIYKYLYNQYDGVRGFTAIAEHGANLNILIDKYNGARLDYNNTAFKTTTGVDGISQSVGLPDKFYGTIEYKVNDVSKISIPDWAPKPDSYPYTGKGFTGSTGVVLPEYFQDTRKFINGDVLNIIDSDSGKIISKFKYDTKFGWIDFN